MHPSNPENPSSAPLIGSPVDALLEQKYKVAEEGFDLVTKARDIWMETEAQDQLADWQLSNPYLATCIIVTNGIRRGVNRIRAHRAEKMYDRGMELLGIFDPDSRW